MRSAAAEREWRWRAGPGAQRAGDEREGERGLREQAGVSWAEGEEVGRSRVGSGREGSELGRDGLVWCWVELVGSPGFEFEFGFLVPLFLFSFSFYF